MRPLSHFQQQPQRRDHRRSLRSESLLPLHPPVTPIRVEGRENWSPLTPIRSLLVFRAVANTTTSSRFESCLMNSKPIPRLAPVTSQTCGDMILTKFGENVWVR